jgi:5-dehydro-4-deoxyglucarate dehydratase
VFNFVAEFATNFHAAVRRRDRQTIHAGLRDFILPLIAIPSRKKGCAVSIVKAGMKVTGRDYSPVRLPLTDQAEMETAELAALVAKLRTAASSQQAAE